MNTVTLPYLEAVEAVGKDAESFLQAQLTADLTTLESGEAGFAGYCDPRGNVLALLRVMRRGDGLVLIASKSLVQPLLATLRKYVLRAEVRFEVITDAVVGISSGDELDYAVTGEAPPTDHAAIEAWRLEELRSGIVWLGPETTAQFLPQMLGLERLGALSFRKGCFPGQEVIARVRYLGKVKRQPMLAEPAENPNLAPGAELELMGEDGPVGSAIVVESANSSGETACFLVARNPDNQPVIALDFSGRRIELSAPAQTWATM